MFEGVYFQFPKLAFLLFFFLACTSLCPLRPNPIYFPNLPFFNRDETGSPLWMWVAKWLMISMLIVALMSPVREIPQESRGYDILIALDPRSITPQNIERIHTFIQQRPEDRIALYVPYESPLMIPLSRDHDRITSMAAQLEPSEVSGKITREIERFFATSEEGMGWMLIVSENPKEWVRSLPIGIDITTIDPVSDWVNETDRDHLPSMVMSSRKYFEYFYIYPLFIGFLAMLAYLFGRNQKGLS